MSLLIERKIDNLLISADKAKIDARVVHHFLDQESYWARGIPFDTVVRAIEHSICLGAYLPDGTLAGFGRMITDQATFAYLADVFVQPAYRGQGISKARQHIARHVFYDRSHIIGCTRNAQVDLLIVEPRQRFIAERFVVMEHLGTDRRKIFRYVHR